MLYAVSACSSGRMVTIGFPIKSAIGTLITAFCAEWHDKLMSRAEKIRCFIFFLYTVFIFDCIKVTPSLATVYEILFFNYT